MNFPNSFCQHLCLQSEPQLPPPSLGSSPRSASGLTRAPLKSLSLHWDSEHVRPCTPFKWSRVFPTALWPSHTSPVALQSQTFWEIIFLVLNSKSGEPNVRLRFLTTWGALILLLFSRQVVSNSSVTPWTVARQAYLSFTISCRLLSLMSIESVIPSNHLILCHPLLLLPSIFPSFRVFSTELALFITWPKYWRFSFSFSPYNEYLGLILLELTGLVS